MGGAACAKIILNGLNTSSLTKNAVSILNPEYTVLENEREIIAHLNKMEDMAVDLQKMILKGLGYSGPVGKMLS